MTDEQDEYCITLCTNRAKLARSLTKCDSRHWFELGSIQTKMKYLLALSCAALLILTTTQAHAEDYRVSTSPLMHNVSVDRKKLIEARALLAEIKKELEPVNTADEPQTTKTQQQLIKETTTTSLYALIPNAPADVKAEALKPAPRAEILNQNPPANEAQAIEQSYKRLDELLVSREGDIEMQCSALSREALEMRNVIYTTQEMKDNAKIKKHGVTAAAGIGSFLIGTVTGGVGLALGGFLLEQSFGGDASDADKIQDIAEQRRTLMMGIYNAKGCYGPLDHAMQSPEIFDPLARIAASNTYEGETPSRYND